ncbi:MAG: GMC oxidoreductase, partial [Pseudomonadota bacterium]
WGKLLAGMQYILTRRGLLSLSVNQAGGFVRSHPSRPHPNMQLYFGAITYTTSGDGERPLMSPDPFPGFLSSIGQIRPTSRGELHVRSADPLQPVEIHPRYLSTEEDQKQMLEGVRLLRELGKAPALAKLIESETTPPPGDGDDELLDDIRNRASTVYHPSCTNSMGPDHSKAVVDHQCRAHGLGRLRVVDTSVFPTVTSGNTNAPTIMVAEKASDMILSDRE